MQAECRGIGVALTPRLSLSLRERVRVRASRRGLTGTAKGAARTLTQPSPGGRGLDDAGGRDILAVAQRLAQHRRPIARARLLPHRVAGLAWYEASARVGLHPESRAVHLLPPSSRSIMFTICSYSIHSKHFSPYWFRAPTPALSRKPARLPIRTPLHRGPAGNTV